MTSQIGVDEVAVDPLSQQAMLRRDPTEGRSYCGASIAAGTADSTKLPIVGFGSAEVAPPSWQLPSRTVLNAGEALLDRPASVDHHVIAPPSSCAGTVFLTNLRILWEPTPLPSSSVPIKGDVADDVVAPTVSVSLNSVEKLRKLKVGTSTTGDGVTIVEVFQKYNARPSMRLNLSEADYVRIHAILRSQIGLPSSNQDMRANVLRSYAVLHGTALSAHSSHGETFSNAFKGWCTFDPEREFHRQGLLNPLSHWRVSKANENFELCPTYPQLLVVPRCIDDETLSRAAAFRSARRVPVLCWKVMKTALYTRS